jgi:hypothetical protein
VQRSKLEKDLDLGSGGLRWECRIEYILLDKREERRELRSEVELRWQDI